MDSASTGRNPPTNTTHRDIPMLGHILDSRPFSALWFWWRSLGRVLISIRFARHGMVRLRFGRLPNLDLRDENLQFFVRVVDQGFRNRSHGGAASQCKPFIARRCKPNG